jgi:hypothetical protein
LDVLWFSLRQTLESPVWALFSLAVLPIGSAFFTAAFLSGTFKRRKLALGTWSLAYLVILLVLLANLMGGVAAGSSPNNVRALDGRTVKCDWFVSIDGDTPYAHSQVSTGSVRAGGNLVGTAGEDIASFLSHIVTSDETVCFGAVTFSVRNSTIPLADNLVFSGIPGGTVFKLAPGTARHLINWGPISNFTVYGITFDGNSHNEADAANRNIGELLVLTSPSNDHIVLDNIVCENARNGACLDLGGKDLDVSNSTFVRNNGDDGASIWPVDHVHFATSLGVRVSGNHFNDCSDTAVAMDHVGSATVLANSFLDCKGQLWTYTSAGGGTSTNATVSGNTFQQTKYLAPAINIAQFGGDTPTALGVTITDNSFSNLQSGSYNLIAIDSAASIIVAQNIIESRSTDINEYAITAYNDTGLSVDNNTLLNIDSAGAGKDTLFQAIAGFSVQGNTFQTASVGLEFGCCAPQSFDGTVVNNTFDNVTSPIIFTTVPSNTTIQNNRG